MLKLLPGQISLAPNRQRQKFDDAALQELANSIQAIGLQNAIVVRPVEGEQYVLVSGERRIRAIQNLHFLNKEVRYGGEVIGSPLLPCVSHGELDALHAEEAELDENIRRSDLTWQERANATARISALRNKQFEKAQESGSFTEQAVAEKAASVAAIAVEVRGSSEGYHQEQTRRELIVSKHLDDPEVSKSKSLDEAMTLLRRREDTQRRVQLAASVGRTFSAELHQALNTDSLAWMKAYTGELFDVVLTDPIYGMGADTFGDSGGKAAGAHSYEDSYETWKATMPVFAEQSFRVTKPAAHLYAFCDFDRFHELKAFLDDAGWDCFRTPLIWVNNNKSRTPWVDFGPQRKYELCIYANKGRKPVTRIFPDVVQYTSDDNLGHEAQKPVALYIDLLRRSVAPGDLVLDPFAGSGTIFPAAHELKCKAVGIELLPQHYALCTQRLEKLKEQQELSLEPADIMAELKAKK